MKSQCMGVFLTVAALLVMGPMVVVIVQFVDLPVSLRMRLATCSKLAMTKEQRYSLLAFIVYEESPMMLKFSHIFI